jgi:SpoVK/Ycf46/Vps4 family AAA+-type ATPase
VGSEIELCEEPLNGKCIEFTEADDAAPTTTKEKDLTMWSRFSGCCYKACEAAVYELPPGQYTVEHSPSIGIYFRKTDVQLDSIVKLSCCESNKVMEEVEVFWNSQQIYKDHGFLWKRGFLLWGPPGSGKTTLLQNLSTKIVERGGLSIYVSNPGLTATAIQQLRMVQPKVPIVLMYEDLDTIVRRFGESELLALLDGELQIDNVLNIATTNYPERLDARIVNRPSRFDIVKYIGMPSEEARRSFLIAKTMRFANNENVEELDKWVEMTKGFGLAHIKELIVSVEVFKVSLEDCVERLKRMSKEISSSTKSIGIGK